MKREGRQHGMVRSCKISPSPSNNHPKPMINQFDTLPTCGIFTKVSSKPTNHSKFTGKCGKPKDKGTKGAHKFRSCDVGKNHRMISWKVVDREAYKGLNYVGASASQVLDQLHKYYQNDHDGVDYDDDVVDDRYVHDGVDDDDAYGYGYGYGFGDVAVVKEVEIVDGGDEDEEDVVVDDDDDDDDDMDFCDVGFVIEQLDGDGDGDEGWCLVGEM